MTKLAKIILTGYMAILVTITSHAYDNKVTHQTINEAAARQSNLDTVLINSLGIQEGLAHMLAKDGNNKTIEGWLKEGGKQEDVPDCRSKYHFHDPTKTFDTAGLSNVAINTACLNWDNESSIMWSQNQDNAWSWQKGREYYYQALTAMDKSIREQKFADTFRAVGQVMHLLADASVPEHTRNDIHIFPWFDNATQSFPQIGSWTYETWCKYHVQNLITNVTAQDYDITNTSAVTGLIPIFNFWDTTPSPITGSFIPVGLAEYSNYNFLSRDTIFKNYTYPVNPQLSSGALAVVPGEDGIPDTKVYFSSTTSDNRPIQHFVSTGYLWSDLQSVSPFSMDSAKFVLDDYCYNDYASILVPKAVAYDAALLNYFFRGQIDIIWTGPNSFKIKNLTNEDMTGSGALFTLLYDDQSDNRYPLSLSFYYDSGIAVSDLSILKKSLSTYHVTVDETVNNPKDYILVFKGTIGNEQDAVAAKVIKPANINIVQTGNNSFKIINYMNSDMTGSLTSLKLFYDNTNNIRKEIPLAITDISGYPVTRISIPAQTVSDFMVSLTQRAVNAKDKGTFILQFTGKLGDKDVVTEQLITPHFITHVIDATGQCDIYEYDLLGNMIANLTEDLPRGVSYYNAQPNPVNSNVVIFNTCADCANQNPSLYQLTKSTGAISLIAQETYDRGDWWSKDGTRVVNTTECNNGQSCGYYYPMEGSYSPDGQQLAVMGDAIAGNNDIIILANNTISMMVDMINSQIVPVNTSNCNYYVHLNHPYNQSNPGYHPNLNKIVFTSDKVGSLDPALGYRIPFNIYAADAAGNGSVARLTNAPAGTRGYYEAAWSPDGEKLLTAGQATANDYSQIYLMPAAGGTPTSLTKDFGNHYYPQWLKYMGQ